MSEAYTKLGIEIEVGKVVTVHTDGVKNAATTLNDEFNKAFKDTNLFGNLAKGISELTAKLGSINFSNLTNGLSAIQKAVSSLDTSTKTATNLSISIRNLGDELRKASSIKVSGGQFDKVTSELKLATQQVKEYKKELQSGISVPNSNTFLTPTSQKSLPNGRTEIIQPYAQRVTGADIPEILKLIASAYKGKSGYAIEDYSLQNFGKVNGKVYGIDADSYTPKAQASVSSLRELLDRAERFMTNEVATAVKATQAVRVQAFQQSGGIKGEVATGGVPNSNGLTIAAQAISQTSKQAQAEIAKNKAEVDNLIIRIKDLEKSNKTLQAELAKASEGRLVYSTKAMEIAATSLNVDRSKLKEALELYSAQQQAQKAVYEKTKGDAGKFADPNQKLIDQQRKEQEQQGTQLLAALKNTRTATKTEQDKIVENWQQYLVALKNSGQQFYNGSVIPKSYITDTGNAWAAAQAEQSKREAAQAKEDQRKVIYAGYANRDADGAYQAYLTNIAKLQSEERRQQEEHGKQLLATLKNTRSMEKAERDKAVQDWQQYLAALKNSGQQYYNGSVVPKSYITDISRAFDLATQQNASKVNNPFKEMLSQLPPLSSSLGDVTRALGLTNSAILALKPDQLQQLKTALAPFKLTVDETTGAIKKMSKEATGLKSVIGSMFARLVEFYSLRTVLFAVGGQFREATAAALDFHQNVKDILAISGESRENFDNIAQSIRNIAKESRYSANEIAQLMQVLAQAGVKGEALPAAARHVGMFATATKTDPKLAGDLFTTAQNNYNIDITNSARITNALTAALNESKLEANGLATAFNYLAPQTAQLGISMEKTLAMIATQAQAGVKPSTIGTGMSQMLKEFAAPKARLQSLLSYYGIAKEDIDPIKNDFATIVDTLNNAMGKAGEKGVQVSHMFSALESRVGRSTVASLKLGGDAFRAMESSITGTSAALIAYEKSMEGARAQMNVTKQLFQEFIFNAVQPLTPAFYAVNQSIQGWLTGLSQINPNLLAAATGIAAVSTALGVLGVTLAGLKAAAGTATGAGFIASLLGITSATALGPILAIVGVLAGITVAIGAIGYGLNKQKREQQELNKAELENIETKQKYYNVLEATQRATEKQHPELKKYAEAVALYGENSKQATEIGNKKVVMTAQQRIEINQLLAKNPQLLASIGKETDLYSAQFKIMQMLNKEKYVNASNAAREYNSRIDSLRAQYAAAAKDKAKFSKIAEFNPSGTAGWEGDLSGNSTAITYKEAAARAAATVEAIKKQTNDPALIALRDKAVGAVDAQLVKVLGKNGKATTKTQTQGWSPQIVSEQGFGFMRMNEETKVETDLPVVGDFTPSGRGSKKDKAAAYGDKSIIEQLKDQSAALKAALQEQTDIIKDTEKTFDERNSAFEAAKENLRKSNAAELYAEVLAETHKFVEAKGVTGYDPVAHFEALKEGRGSEFTLNTSNDAILQKLQANIRAINEKSSAMYSKEMAKLNKENLDTNKKFLDEFNKQAEKIDEEAYKRRADSAKRAIEFAFKQTGSGAGVSEMLNSYLEATNAKIDSKYNEEGSKLTEWFRGLTPDQQAKERNRYLTEIKNVQESRALDKDAKLSEIMNSGISGIEGRVIKDDKRTDVDLAQAQQRIALGKELASTADEVNKLEAEGIDLSIKATKAKTGHAKAALLSLEAIKKEFAAKQNLSLYELDQKGTTGKLGAEAQSVYDTLTRLAGEYGERIQSNTLQLQQQRVELARQQDTSFLGNFTQGVESAWKSLSDFKGQTKQLGSDLTNAFTNGLSSTVSNTFTTLFNPDTQKINELNAKIAELRTQKTTLESDIATIEANSSKTPEEIKNLNEKKVALDNVNNSLKEQEAAVRKQKDAWSTFSDGLKNVMKSILQELQNYIAKMFVVWAVNKLVGLAEDSFIGDMFPSLFGYKDGGVVKGYADGGLINGTAGGFIPNNMGVPGKDSVPILAMPGEVIIKKSAVDYYGADKLLALNQGKLAKFSEGGMVGGTSTPAAKSSTGTNEFTLQVVNVAQPSEVPSADAQTQQIINVINSDIARRGPTYKTIKAVVAG